MRKIIEYFSDKHILTNFIIIIVMIGGIAFWNSTNKEDMPNITFDMARISASYSGATAEEVDYHILQPIEEALAGIDGIKSMNSTASQGGCSLFLELDPDSSNRKNVIDDITSAMNSLRLPEDVETPRVREFKSNRRAVMDIAIYYDGQDILSDEKRRELQVYCDTLDNKLSRLPSVSEIGLTNYLDEYIEINVDPEKLALYDVSLSDIISILKKSSLRLPIGSLKDETSTRLRLDTELNDIKVLRDLVIKDTFDGVFYTLKDMANVALVMEDRDSLYKVNGNEAITLRVTKTSSSGILVSTDSIKKLVHEFETSVLAGTDIKLSIISDNSIDVRNRLSLITSNGIFGFILIVLMLFIFLDAKSGLWVALGIPFTLACTMIFSSLFGNTINNMTLAAVIIVLGMVVDDAIVVAENVNRLHRSGMPRKEATVKGTVQVFVPIVASIVTTCVAFIPLFFFQGFFGMMTRFLPVIIFLMLGASLFEALFILPSHLRVKIPSWIPVVASLGLVLIVRKIKANKKIKETENSPESHHWFMKVEAVYGRFLLRMLKKKPLVYLALMILFLIAGFLFMTKMKYEMFPREESTEYNISGKVPEGLNKYETESAVRKIEDVFTPYLGKEVMCYRTSIARSRRGMAVEENSFSIQVELVPKEKRKKSSKQLNAEWEQAIRRLSGFPELNFAAQRWGHSSGSPIDIVVQENNSTIRDAVAEEIVAYLKTMPSLANPEVEREIKRPQYILRLKEDVIYKLNISADTVASTLRTILEGNNVFNIILNDRDIEVMLTVKSELRKSLDLILNIPIRTSGGYYVPLKKIVTVEKDLKADSIQKLGGKQTLHVYADLYQPPVVNKEQPGNDPEKSFENTKTDTSKVDKDSTGSGEGGDAGKNKWARQKEKKEPGVTMTMLDLPLKMTPIEIAEHLETNLFPRLMQKHPTTEISFSGEIQDTRESSKDFSYAIIFTVVFIYMILALTLNSLSKPFIILLAIPFGCVGIIFTLNLHGMMVYGFFSVIGALGLAGVIVNDSIVLLTKLDREYKNPEFGAAPVEKVANIAKTRLRAVLLTTFTTVAGLLPTAYGVFGYDSMLAEMMLTMAWGLMFGTIITLVLVPSIYCTAMQVGEKFKTSKETAQVIPGIEKLN
ncbi:MAG: efflux RND transporter permease subunit [Spirochaetales bacterium]|nr:efflux RND transporter permease subunit [Spirochaetales bacterium]